MATYHLFVKHGCEKCDWLKNNINGGAPAPLRFHELDDRNPMPLALLAYYECVGIAEKNMPILVIDYDTSRTVITELSTMAFELGVTERPPRTHTDDGQSDGQSDNQCVGNNCAL